MKFREKLNDLATVMLSIPNDEHAEIGIKHYFSKGAYTREATIKAGTLVLGRIHKFPTINILSKGKITIVSEEGVLTIEAPYTFVSGPDVQKAGFTHEDTVWTNVFATNETDPEKALDEVTIDPKTYLDFYKSKELTAISDQEDFLRVITELKLTPEQVREMSEYQGDLTELKAEYPVQIRESKIEGLGLFATENIAAGQTILPARIDSKRTIAGRYTNHSANPNCEMVWFAYDPPLVINLVATKEIKENEELTINYRQAWDLSRKIDREVLCQQ